MATRDELPSYQDLMYPTLTAVNELGGSAQGREITAQVLEEIGATPELLELTYDKRPKSVLIDRIDWARSYVTLGGVLERPRRGLFVLSPLGREILAKPADEAKEQLRSIDRDVRAKRRATTPTPVPADEEGELADDGSLLDEEEPELSSWREVLLTRLHRLSPKGFEEFAIYLLKTFGMELTRVGGSGDEGIDGVGLAPLSAVLSTRVAVQAKRYDPASAVGREVVALFQRDASAAGAERAVLITLGRFTAAAQKAAIAARPTVDLIDGDRLCDLVEQQGIGLRNVPRVTEAWFDRFD